MSISNTAWTDSDVLANATWARNSGIDTSVPTYDDATISYDEITEYYDGYDATTITEDDVHFSAFTNDTTLANSAYANDSSTINGTPLGLLLSLTTIITIPVVLTNWTADNAPSSNVWVEV